VGYAVLLAETRGFLSIMNKLPQVFRRTGGSPALQKTWLDNVGSARPVVALLSVAAK